MVWNDKKIRESKAVIPMRDEMISPASIDLTLEALIDDSKKKYVLDSAHDTLGDIILKPGDFYLGVTSEQVHIPDDAVGIVKGKSSWGRQGVMVECAGVVDSGYVGPVTLQIKNLSNQDVTVRAGDRICQVMFFDLCQPAEHPYRGHYQGGKITANLQGIRDKEKEGNA